jgi:predicted transcriptional regulator
MEGEKLSNTNIAALNINAANSITIRIGVKETARNRGGINLFGSKFGNHAQDLKLSIQLA